MFTQKISEDFNPTQTLDCGQVFRYEITDSAHIVYAGANRCEITQKDGNYLFFTDNERFFKKYFDFDRNYAIICSKVEDKPLVRSAVACGRGIKILNQEPVEALFSFIVSQNNNIPRIKKIIARMCDDLGEDMGGYHAFPTVEALANAGESYFASIGAGYRAAYLERTAREIQNQNVSDWVALDTDALRQKLISLYGVGRKVADCVLLFGFHRCDVFPVDTWIEKVFADEYPGVSADKLSKLLVERYGDTSGYVQQWLYYFARERQAGRA